MSQSYPDPHAFADLLCEEYPHLLRLCLALTRDSDAAQDVAQDTLVEAWRQRHKVYDTSGLRPWLKAIARHVSQRWLARHRFTMRHELPLPDDAAEMGLTLSATMADGEA